MAQSAVQIKRAESLLAKANPISRYETPFPTWKFPQWQPQYEDAILEFDTEKLPTVVEAASVAIYMRLECPQTTAEERRALSAALRSVRVKVKRLNRRNRPNAVG
jgi:hypothetical protein